MRVVLLPEVLDYLVRLAEILYEKQYLSWEETAEKYVLELYDDIIATLPTRLHRPAPPHFDPEGKGMWVASFRKNRATTWYVFFTRYDDGGETVFLVRRIENNHTAAHYF
jgi:hypothetical protein